MDSPLLSDDHRWDLSGRSTLIRCLRGVDVVLGILREPYRVEIETQGLEVIPLRGLEDALTDKRACKISMISQSATYRVCVTGGLDSRPVSVQIYAHGATPRSLMDAVRREIQRHIAGDARPTSRARQVWAWFRARVWAELVAGVIAGVAVAALAAYLWPR